MNIGEKKQPTLIYLVYVLLLAINSTTYIILLLIYSILNLFTISIHNNYMGKEAESLKIKCL